MSGDGDNPVEDEGWPEGALAVANLKSRVGWWEGPPFGGGEWQFLYRGDTETFGQALAAFADIRAPALELVIHDGPEHNRFLEHDETAKTDTRVDWAFTVWVPEKWHRLYNNPTLIFDADDPRFRQPVAPPQLDVYLGGGGKVDWAKVKMPAGIRVRDERASAVTAKPIGGAGLRADIFDMATGKPVCSAHITVEQLNRVPKQPVEYERIAEAASDATGRVQIEKIPPGFQRVRVAADGYVPRVLDNNRFSEGIFTSFIVELARPARIRGMVISADGKPIQGAELHVFSILALNGRGYKPPELPTTKSDQAGQFELAGLPVGYIQFYAQARGYHVSEVSKIHGVPATNMVLRLARAGDIRVSIRDKEGRALSLDEGHQLLVQIQPKESLESGSHEMPALVKADGTADFLGVLPGEYRLTSRPNPFMGTKKLPPEQIITVRAGEVTSVEIVYE